MKVIQASKAYYPHIGGIETVVQQLAEGVCGRHGIESEVIVCSETFRRSSETINDVSVMRSGSYFRLASLPASPGYTSLLMSRRSDVLHIHEPSLLPSISYLMHLKAAKTRFGKLVVWWHSDIVRQRLLKPLYSPMLHSILRLADTITVATPKHISSSSYLTQYSHKCKVIHYGMDPGRFRLTSRMSMQIQKLRETYKKPIVLFVGRLVYYKGVDVFAKAASQFSDAQFIVVGRGPLDGLVKSMAVKSGSGLVVIPFLDDEDLTAMFHAAELFVLPSTEISEGFGIVQLQAMMCGKPVVTSDLPTGVTYVNQDGVTGLVSSVGDSESLASKIRLLLDDNDLRTRLGEQARQRAIKNFHSME